MDDPDLRWMTYPEMGEAFGIAAASAKRLAIRRRWPKRPGNDNRARVGLPVEAIPIRAAGDVASDRTSDDAKDVARAVAGDDTGAVTAVVAVFQRHVERIEKELAEAKEHAADRDQVAGERDGLKAQIEMIQVELDGVKAVLARADQLAGSLRAERDRLLTERYSRSLWQWLFG